jgi:hypothetical protein
MLGQAARREGRGVAAERFIVIAVTKKPGIRHVLTHRSVAAMPPQPHLSQAPDMVDELELGLTSLIINGRRVHVRRGQFYALRQAEFDVRRGETRESDVRSWSAWVLAYHTTHVDGEVIISARSDRGIWLTGPAVVSTTVTPTGTYIEMRGVSTGWIAGLGEGWD